MSRHSPKEIERIKQIAAKMQPRYYAKEYARGCWHVIAPDGFPVYDNQPYGMDKPLVFHNEDMVLDYVERCNREYYP